MSVSPSSLSVVSVSHLSYQLDPYPMYAQLREGDLLKWDATCAAWIASRAEAVHAVLQNSDCVVRPSHEQVPKAIQGSAAGTLFAQLIRMNEGSTHQALKSVLSQVLSDVDSSEFGNNAQALLDDQSVANMCKADDGAQLTQWMMQVPIRCMAMLLGFDRESSALMATDIAEFVACLSPLSSAQQLLAASDAAQSLTTRMREHIAAHQDHRFTLGFQKLCDADQQISPESRIANLVGLLSQTYEATAGLLGNCLVQLHQRPSWRADLASEAWECFAWRRAFVEEVARFDPSIHSTRRFAKRDCQVLGQKVCEGDLILLLLAAANRDTHAERKDGDGGDEFNPLLDVETTQWGFSAGRHRCPGQSLAITIVVEAVSYVIDHWKELDWQKLQYHYLPSLNARIPVFTQKAGASIAQM